jgi:hypothetical protein
MLRQSQSSHVYDLDNQTLHKTAALGCSYHMEGRWRQANTLSGEEQQIKNHSIFRVQNGLQIHL